MLIVLLHVRNLNDYIMVYYVVANAFLTSLIVGSYFSLRGSLDSYLCKWAAAEREQRKLSN